MPEFDLVGYMMSFEAGELGDQKTIELFSVLIKNGTAWSLQGSYGRFAKALIEAGYLSNKGDILKEVGAE
jgi:hypothetical protein